jgi:NAD(P)-dependent dehydrogenase (short-subunit alcohol dehydrogenase family)
MKLSNRIALITGGGRGIGRAVAFAFAREGARVAVVARTQQEIVRVAEEIKAECGVETMHAICDVSDKESIARAFVEVERGLGVVDILVNNAGIAESAPLVKTSDELWERHLAINLSGTARRIFLLTRHRNTASWD